MRVWMALGGAACAGGAVSIDEPPATETGEPTDDRPDAGEGWADGPIAWELEDDAPPRDERYDDAYAQITSPPAGAVLQQGEVHTFSVQVRNPAGMILPAAAVAWQASNDLDFWSDEASFTTDSLAVGRHTLTALLDLPDGGRVAHSVSNIRVQDAATGTYAGLFGVDGTIQNITVSCVGAATLSFGELGFLGEGEGDCLISLLGASIPMTWIFNLENHDGDVRGEAGVRLIGIFSYDIPVTGGSLDPNGDGLDVTFAGPIPFIGELAAFLRADRVSLDPLP